MVKSWKKWEKLEKSGKKWGKVVKSGEKWGKVGKVDKSGEKWRKVMKSGEKLEKKPFFLVEIFGQNGRRRPFWIGRQCQLSNSSEIFG